MRKIMGAVVLAGALVGCASTPPAAAPSTVTVVSAAPQVTVTQTIVSTVTATPATPSSTASTKFNLFGKFVMKGSDGFDQTCTDNRSGYSDIREGTAVTVYDQAGTVLATGDIEGGKWAPLVAGDKAGLGDCTYDVSVKGVPDSATFYQVEISHRGKITVSNAEAKAGEFSATLGS